VTPVRAALAILAIAVAVTSIGWIACTCARARLRNGWCDACRVGYVAGVPVRSAMLFEALDAHGHDIDPASIECAECRAAIGTDGFCPACRRGFVKGQLYFSRLTYAIANGSFVDPVAITCPHCRGIVEAEPARAQRRIDAPEEDRTPGASPAPGGNSARPGDDETNWCAECGIGYVGNVAFRDRAMLAVARTEHDRLLRAIAMTDRCASCAVAFFMGARCPRCRIDYREAPACGSG
jgi:hypothetical protein